MSQAPHEQLRAMFDATPDAILVFAPDGSIVDVNDSLCRLFGCTRDEALANPLGFGEQPPDALREARGRLLRAFDGEAQDFEWSVCHRGGAWFPVEVRLRRIAVLNTQGGFLVLAFMRDLTQQRRAEAALRASEERYRAMFDRNLAMKWIVDPTDGSIVDVNEATARFYGWPKEQMRRMKVTDINVAPAHVVMERLREAADEEQRYFNFRHRKASGEIVDVEVHSGSLVLDGRPLVFAVVHDISEKKQLEESLRQAQKMEAVGRLAGGVAHDFNNLMTVIVGASSLMLKDLPEGEPHRERLVEIAEAGRRAARLTRQLLAVGRRQLLAPQTLDLNTRVSAMMGILRPVLPAHITLDASLVASPAWVVADPDQLEQVVLNLALNARDAMPGGGTLAIRSGNVEVHEPHPSPAELPAGTWVVLEVSDTGRGIDPSQRTLIFEPFFTTKPGDEGSGLGLATVYGIVKQSGGHILVDSTLGKGSTFRVALPAASPPPAAAPGPLAVPAPASVSPRGAPLGRETILVVDDDELVRRLTGLMLEAHGYRVRLARDGEDALRIAREEPFQVLLTDVMMPGITGIALVEKLRATIPGIRVLFVSGYVEDTPSPDAPATHTGFLQKPVTPEELAAKIRALLDG